MTCVAPHQTFGVEHEHVIKCFPSFFHHLCFERLRDGAMTAAYSRLSGLPSTLMLCFFSLLFLESLNQEHCADSDDHASRDADPEIQRVPTFVLLQLGLEILFPRKVLAE